MGDGCPAVPLGGGHPSVGEVGPADYVAWGDARVGPGRSQAGVHLRIRYGEDPRLFVSGRHLHVEAIGKAREVFHFAQIVGHLV